MASKISALADVFKSTVTHNSWPTSYDTKYAIGEGGLTQGADYRRRTLESRSRPVQPVKAVPDSIIQRGSLPMLTASSLIEGMTGEMAAAPAAASPAAAGGSDSTILNQLEKQRQQFNSILAHYNGLVENPPVDASSNQSYQTELESVNQMLISVAKDMYQNVEFAEKEMKGGKSQIEATMGALLEQIKALNEHGTKHDTYKTTMKTLDAEQANLNQQIQMSNYAYYGLTAAAVILGIMAVRQIM